MRILLLSLIHFLSIATSHAQRPTLSGTIEAGSDNFSASFQTEDDKFYIIQTSTDLINFTSIGMALVGNGEQQTVVLPRTAQKQFYRVFESDNSNVDIDTTKGGLPGADYDSGWVQIATGQTLSLNHGLGVLPRLTIMWGSRSEPHSQIFHMDAKTVRGFGEIGCVIENLTSESFEIQAGGHFADPRGLTGSPIWVRVYFWK